MFCVMKANKEGTKAVSQRAIQQVLWGFPDTTAGPEQAQSPDFQKVPPSSRVGLNYSARCFRVCLVNGERIESGMYIS